MMKTFKNDLIIMAVNIFCVYNKSIVQQLISHMIAKNILSNLVVVVDKIIANVTNK